jgi:hypothetical protein
MRAGMRVRAEKIDLHQINLISFSNGQTTGNNQMRDEYIRYTRKA